MSRAHEKIIRMQHDWMQHGKAKDYLLPPLDASLANNWLYHHSGKRDKNVPSPVDPDGTLQAFVDKSLESVDIDALLRQRESCFRCGQTNKLENMLTCTLCHRSICWQCETGSNICRCGGEMF